MLNYKQIWHGIKPIRWVNKFNLTKRLLIMWRNETDAHLFDDFLGYQNVLRTLVPLPYIKREDKR